MRTPAVRMLRWLGLIIIVFGLGLLCKGRELLVAVDPLPAHVDAAVVLQGSIAAEKVRVAGAMSLLQRGVAGRVVIIVPKESYWGQAIAPVAHGYLERTYGADVASHVDFCETSADVSSTRQEAKAALDCVQSPSLLSLAVVTSDYHSRRAGILWRRAIEQRGSNVGVFMQGVADPDFESPWWRHRQSAKIWWNESGKLIWAALVRN